MAQIKMNDLIKPTARDIEAFQKCYGTLHHGCAMAEGMCDAGGDLKPFTREKLAELQTTCREAACAAGAMNSVRDGKRE
jgi:hypothetical protein